MQAASWDTEDYPKQLGNKVWHRQNRYLTYMYQKASPVRKATSILGAVVKRAREYAMSKGNYDPTREHLNFEVTQGGKVRPVDTSRSIPERMAAILRSRGIKDPNEGLEEPKFRTVVNIIFGGSRERMQELAFGSQTVDF